MNKRRKVLEKYNTDTIEEFLEIHRKLTDVTMSKKEQIKEMNNMEKFIKYLKSRRSFKNYKKNHY